MLLGGGAALAIPALPSLLREPSRARAQEVLPKRMVVFMTEHGGVWQEDFFPAESQASTPVPHELHAAHWGDLRSTLEGGDRVVSQTLRASDSVFTESLASKMNVIRGLDVPFYYGHARHILGNYGDMSNNHEEPTPEQQSADQVLAYSSAVYATPPRRRVVNFSYEALSVGYADRAAGAAGGFQAAEEVTAQSVFDSIYVESVPGEVRRPPVDAVHESYRRLSSGAFGAGARLGGEDRRRLEQYMDRLSDIRAGLNSAVGAYCGDVTPRADYPGQWDSRYTRANAHLLNEIILAAFMCDSSRIAVVRTGDPFSDGMESDGGYHEVAHNSAGGPDADAGLVRRLSGLMRDGNRTFFQEAFMDLVAGMDALGEGDGTMLDQSLVWWSHEAGAATHNGDSIPVVSFGGLGGTLATGRYLDYRDRTARPFGDGQEVNCNVGRRPGACYFQWTTTYLDAFGVPRAEWQPADRKAFSAMGPNHSWMTMQYDLGAMDESCDVPLPELYRG